MQNLRMPRHTAAAKPIHTEYNAIQCSMPLGEKRILSKSALSFRVISASCPCPANSAYSSGCPAGVIVAAAHIKSVTRTCHHLPSASLFEVRHVKLTPPQKSHLPLEAADFFGTAPNRQNSESIGDTRSAAVSVAAGSALSCSANG